MDAGNTLSAPQGPVKSSEGQVIIEAMNMLGYDAMALGAQDLPLGIEALRKRMAEAKFPILSANLTIAEGGQLFASPYVIKEMAGHRIAIIGLTGSDQSSGSPPSQKGPFVVKEPIETAKRYVKEVSTRADIVILLSNVGLPLDQKISEQIPGIDIIIGGQTRSLLTPTRHTEKGAVIAQAGYRGEWIGSMQVEFDARGNVVNFQGQTVALAPEYSDDAQMREFLNRIQGKP